MPAEQPSSLSRLMRAFHDHDDIPPSIHWLVALLARLEPHHPVDVVLRPAGDRRRECKVHLSSQDREVLRAMVDKVKGTRQATRGDQDDCDDIPNATDPTDAQDLYTLELEILRVVAATGRPLAGKVVAARLGRKYSGWVKTCLARLVKLGLLAQGSEGYGLGRQAGDRCEVSEDADAAEAAEGPVRRPLYFDPIE